MEKLEGDVKVLVEVLRAIRAGTDLSLNMVVWLDQRLSETEDDMDAMIEWEAELDAV